MRNFNRQLRDGGAFLLGAGIVAIIGAAFPSHVTAASTSITAAASPSPKPITCSYTGTSSCLDVTNSSSGVAVYGTSKSGTGLRGASTSNNGLKATSTSSYGIYGQSSSGPAGIYGTMKNQVGILGADTGYGVGVEGTAAGTSATVDDNGVGVYGVSYGSNGQGVIGRADKSYSGSGVLGIAAHGDAVEAETVDGDAIYASAGSTNSSAGTAIYALSAGGPAIHAESKYGNGAVIEGYGVGITGSISTSTGYPLYLEDSSSNTIFDVDQSGNVTYSGSLKPSARTRSGASATAYGATTTAPTLEDTGTGRLINGAASVALDAVFAATIDATAPYRVLITPDGDSRGLYVASKSSTGFLVRESQGGRSTMDFDYRIVAVKFGHAGDRMALNRAADVKPPHLAAHRPRVHHIPALHP